MASSVWDTPNLAPAEHRFAKLTERGDNFSGVILFIGTHTFPATKETPDPQPKPQITFKNDADGQEWVWTAGQTAAIRKLMELRPEVGDWFKATLVSLQAVASGGKFKEIDIEVKKGGGSTEVAPPF